MTLVQIESQWAKAANDSARADRVREPYPDETWEGEIPLERGTSEPPLAEIYRLFNRVDEDDALRLEAWGYRLPSLSVGDVVTVAGESFVCMPFGWEPATDEARELAVRAVGGPRMGQPR